MAKILTQGKSGPLDKNMAAKSVCRETGTSLAFQVPSARQGQREAR